MNSNIIICVSNLTKFYDKILAVDHVNFGVERGEVFGFLGPNGAGKTTTIKMLTGFSKPTHGKASIFGLDVNSHIVQIKKISGLFQKLQIFMMIYPP